MGRRKKGWDTISQKQSHFVRLHRAYFAGMKLRLKKIEYLQVIFHKLIEVCQQSRKTC